MRHGPLIKLLSHQLRMYKHDAVVLKPPSALIAGSCPLTYARLLWLQLYQHRTNLMLWRVWSLCKWSLFRFGRIDWRWGPCQSAPTPHLLITLSQLYEECCLHVSTSFISAPPAISIQTIRVLRIWAIWRAGFSLSWFHRIVCTLFTIRVHIELYHICFSPATLKC